MLGIPGLCLLLLVVKLLNLVASINVPSGTSSHSPNPIQAFTFSTVLKSAESFINKQPFGYSNCLIKRDNPPPIYRNLIHH